MGLRMKYAVAIKMSAKIYIMVLIMFLHLSFSISQNTNSSLEKDWKDFKSKFRKGYRNSTQERHRRRVWENNWKTIQEHNKNGSKSFKMGINNFSDMTHEEFKSIYLPFKTTVNISNNVSSGLRSLSLPTSFSWTSMGFVTGVKDQKSCGSCWAFSAIGAIESQNYKKNNTLLNLSEQQLVDCSKKNDGCNGGLMSLAFEYIQGAGGVQLQSDYPYTALDSYCKFDKNRAVLSVIRYVNVSQNEDDLANVLVNIGPISVGMDASSRSFQSYKSGVYDISSCSSTRLDHAVLLVGYGVTSDNRKYWILKNSWGTNWGQSGYFWLAKDDNNRCGVASMASYPILNTNMIKQSPFVIYASVFIWSLQILFS